MNEVLSRIQQADDIEINEIIEAVMQRYMEVFPGWEVMFLPLPRNDPEACIRKLDKICEFLRNHSK